MRNVSPSALTQRKQFLSTSELAFMLGVSAKTILRWAEHGENGFPPPSVNRARCHRWRRSLIEDWLRENERNGANA